MKVNAPFSIAAVPHRYTAIEKKLATTEQEFNTMAAEKLSNSALRDVGTHMTLLQAEVKHLAECMCGLSSPHPFLHTLLNSFPGGGVAVEDARGGVKPSKILELFKLETRIKEAETLQAFAAGDMAARVVAADNGDLASMHRTAQSLTSGVADMCRR
jgi:hypothetical protein